MHFYMHDKFTSDIDENDRKIISGILDKYDYNILLVEKVRSAYKVYTDRGTFCLKKIGNGYNRGKKAYLISRHLKSKGFANLADYIITKNGYLFIRHNKSTYYMTKWINGSEISFGSKSDIERCCTLMAEFHNSAGGFNDTKEIRIKKRYNQWNKILESRWNEVRSQYKQLKKNIEPDSFEELFRTHYKSFYRYYRLSEKILKSKHFKKAAAQAEKEKYICHDSFYYQNILAKDNKLYVIDLESCSFDIPVYDLGKLIRRILSRNKYKWDFDLCRRMIQCYSKARPLSKDELYVLLAFIIYPHKYWKLARKRFVKKKEWGEEKFLRRLRKMIDQLEYIDEFITCYISFYKLELKK